MTRAARSLPHILIAAYMISVNFADFTSRGLGIVSLAGLLAMGFVLFLTREPDGISPVGKAYLIYFAASAAAVALLPGWVARFLSRNPAPVLYACLFAVVVVPMLLGPSYFTEHFARKSTPAAVWKTDVFKTINRNMSWMWAGIFAAAAASALLPSLLRLPRTLLTGLVGQMALPACLVLLLGVPLNRRYPAYYRRKRGIEAVGHPAGPGRSGSPLLARNDRSAGAEGTPTGRLRVVAINGSPHAGIGNTSIMLQMMNASLAEKGIDLEEIFLAEKRIEFCVGCAVCLEKGKCWRQDDHAEILGKTLAADGVILASPVYFKNVTAQMKAFIDRSLGYGHKPRPTWKPGLAVSVSAGMGETATAEYLAGTLRHYGAFPVGTLTAIAVGPGAFIGMDLVEARAKDLARALARAIKEKRRYPASDRDLSFYLFMRDLVQREKDFMRADYKHWEATRLFEGFETYVQQAAAAPRVDPEVRKAWVRETISKELRRTKGTVQETGRTPVPRKVDSCRELISSMPLGFKEEAAGELSVVYQFEISGAETFTAQLEIENARCSYLEGARRKPDVIIKSPAEVWLAISRGEMDGQSAFMTGKYTVQGDLSLLFKLRELFGA